MTRLILAATIALATVGCAAKFGIAHYAETPKGAKSFDLLAIDADTGDYSICFAGLNALGVALEDFGLGSLLCTNEVAPAIDPSALAAIVTESSEVARDCGECD